MAESSWIRNAQAGFIGFHRVLGLLKLASGRVTIPFDGYNFMTREQILAHSVRNLRGNFGILHAEVVNGVDERGQVKTQRTNGVKFGVSQSSLGTGPECLP